MASRLRLDPCPHADVLALQEALGCSGPLAQVLVRRGLAEPDAARAWLAAADDHDPALFAGMDEAVALVLRHVEAGSRITVHGDYDVDGVCSTTILLDVLELLGADADWFLPSRTEDGYGLGAATVARLAARGTKLLITVDCAITAVDEVAAARAAGLDVLVTDHHAPRADGALPDCAIVHPAVCGYPVAELCAAGVAHKLARALLAGAGRDPALADEDLDLVALATVADCVPLVGENRRLVRAGLRGIAATRKPGLRALLRVSRVDPSAVDASSIGFRLAPRINAAGRMQRADAGVELLRTRDEARAEQIAEELDRLNGDRRHTEQRILFEAEKQVAEADAAREAEGLGPSPAYVLAGDGWHPGVIGIVASRIADRHHRPVVVLAFGEGADTGTGSGRSIPAFDLLGGLNACAAHLERHGGHRAAAGCTIARAEVAAFRAAFCAHAEAVLAPEDLVRAERADAVVSGDELGLDLAEELEQLAPFGMGNPEPRLLVPAAKLVDPRPMGGEGRHLRFVVLAGGRRAERGRVPDHDAARWRRGGRRRALQARAQRVERRRGAPAGPAPGARLRARADHARRRARGLGRRGPRGARRTAAAVHDARGPAPRPPDGLQSRGRRHRGRAHGARRLGRARAGGLRRCPAPAREPRGAPRRLRALLLDRPRARPAGPGATHHHVVVLDPAPHPALGTIVHAGRPEQLTHLCPGPPELGFAQHVHHEQHALRDHTSAAYRLLRGAPGDVAGALPRSPVAAARVLRVLRELGLVELEPATLRVTVPPFAGRTDLERSPTFAACAKRLAEGEPWLRPGYQQVA